jgi:hypothetical protein
MYFGFASFEQHKALCFNDVLSRIIPPANNAAKKGCKRPCSQPFYLKFSLQ